MTPGDSLRLAMTVVAGSIVRLPSTVATQFGAEKAAAASRPGAAARFRCKPAHAGSWSVIQQHERAIRLGRPAVAVRAGELLEALEPARGRRTEQQAAPFLAGGVQRPAQAAEGAIAERAPVGELQRLGQRVERRRSD